MKIKAGRKERYLSRNAFARLTTPNMVESFNDIERGICQLKRGNI